MKTLMTSTLALLVAGTTEAQAANLGLITSPPNAINLLVLVIAVFCVLSALKVLSLVKGGSMAKGWQLFAIGFTVLVLGQLAAVVTAVEIFTLPTYVAPIMLFIASGIILYGLFEIKRVLS